MTNVFSFHLKFVLFEAVIMRRNPDIFIRPPSLLGQKTLSLPSQRDSHARKTIFILILEVVTEVVNVLLISRFIVDLVFAAFPTNEE